MEQVKPYQPKNKIRIVTAASLFDGHDAAINIMRRIIQSTGAEVIHLGHDRSVEEVVNCAIEEDAHLCVVAPPSTTVNLETLLATPEAPVVAAAAVPRSKGEPLSEVA